MKTAAEWIAKALREVGNDEVNATFDFGFAHGTLSGTFTVSVNGLETDAIEFPCSAVELSDALQEVRTVGADGVVVTGPIGGPFHLEFVGGNAGQVVPLPLVDGSLLDPVQDVQMLEVRQGRSTNLENNAKDSWDDHDDVANLELRHLLVKADLIEVCLGSAVNEVDSRLGRENVTEVKSSQRYKQLQDMTARVDKKILNLQATLSAGYRRPAGALIEKMTPNGLPFGVLGVNGRSGRLE